MKFLFNVLLLAAGPLVALCGALAGAVLTLPLDLLRVFLPAGLQQLLWPDDRDLAEVDDCASVRHGESASPWSEGSCEDDAVDTDYAISVGEGEEFVALPVAASNGIPDFAFLTLLAGMTRGPSVMMIEGR